MYILMSPILNDRDAGHVAIIVLVFQVSYVHPLLHRDAHMDMSGHVTGDGRLVIAAYLYYIFRLCSHVFPICYHQRFFFLERNIEELCFFSLSTTTLLFFE